MKKFLIIFLVVIGIVSVSNAEIEPNVQYYGWFDFRQSSATSIGTYTKSDIYTALTKFINDDYSDLITIMNDLIDTNVVSRWYAGTWTSDGKSCLVAIPYGVDAEMFHVEGDTNPYKVCFPNCTVSDYCWIMLGNALYENTSKGTKPNYNLAFSLLNPQFNIKELYIPTGSSGYYVWDGVTYYYEAQTEPDVPSFSTSLTDAEIVSVVQNFYNSDFYKNSSRRDNQFFIMHNEETDFYSILTYKNGTFMDTTHLEGIFIPAGVSNDEFFEASEDGWQLRFITDDLMWQSNSFHYYSTSDGINFNDEGLVTFGDFAKIRWSMLSPIVYSTEEIPFSTLSVDENGESSLIESETVSKDNVTGSDSIDVPEISSNPVIRAIQNAVSSLLNGIKGLFVPSDTYFSERFERLKTALNNRLPITSLLSIFETFKSVSAGELSPITITLYGNTYTIVDFKYFNEYKATINNWVRGFVYFFLILYNISQIYKLIRGDTLSGNALQFGQNSGYSGSGNFGFKKKE